MFTPRTSRRRHILDTYVRLEVEERAQEAENERGSGREEPSGVSRREPEEEPDDGRDRPRRLSV